MVEIKQQPPAETQTKQPVDAWKMPLDGWGVLLVLPQETLIYFLMASSE